MGVTQSFARGRMDTLTSAGALSRRNVAHLDELDRARSDGNGRSVAVRGATCCAPTAS